ncbi:IS5 family transposase [Planctopirus hydrillae]|uniref:Transposase n=1 Tax=Planctopirus hydrillae TaxID=1841610 RepID=A0A1C3E913_9PLAN|nr:IS5 family transposase [Planctopirus hydrillae]ODA29723.1 transposase [Planctopirus hydrillae]
MLKRHALSDELWKRIEPLCPGKAGDPGRTAADNRLFVEGVIFVLKTGISWADLPERFGLHNSVWRRYDRWCERGTWQKIAQALQDPELEEVQIDSTTVKAHPVAATGRRQAGEKKTRPVSAAVWDAVAVD